MENYKMNNKKLSKRFNHSTFKTYSNFYWGKYVSGGWLKIMKFEAYLQQCHLF